MAVGLVLHFHGGSKLISISLPVTVFNVAELSLPASPITCTEFKSHFTNIRYGQGFVSAQTDGFTSAKMSKTSRIEKCNRRQHRVYVQTSTSGCEYTSFFGLFRKHRMCQKSIACTSALQRNILFT